MTQQILIGSAKAAALLRVNRSTLTRIVASGALEPLERGTGRTGAMYFSPTDVQRLKAKRDRVAK